jgi:hypothetical protein
MNLLSPMRNLSLVLVAAVLFFSGPVLANDPNAASGKQVAERLQRGVDNPEQENNIYRGGEAVKDINQVKDNMRKLFRKLLVSEVGGEVDKAYNPHLRDAMFSNGARTKMATARMKAGAVITTWVGFPFFCFSCLNNFGTQTACNLCNLVPCPWNIPWFDHHIYSECCGFPDGLSGAPVDTSVYGRFTQDTNFKACCVRNDMKYDSEELVACKSKNILFNPLHAFNPIRGDGWSGLTEIDLFTTAIGLENDRSNSMIATNGEVKQCLKESDTLMQSGTAPNWVADAIKRNSDWADKAGGSGGASGGAGGSPADAGQVLAKVQEDIEKVRPSGANANLRFSDSMGSEGITVRPNLAVMDAAERVLLAKHFCFRPEQFLKLMNPIFDPLQKGGGPDWSSLATTEFLWANYCANGVKLMTDPKLSRIQNLHRTSTDFVKGMEAWERDPLYCQRLQATQNANFANLGISDAIESTNTAGGGPKSAQELGYTCLEGGKVNLGMVPATFVRNSAVERRTAIADKLFGFLIAGTLSVPLNRAFPLGSNAPRSYLKGFEPRPYSLRGPQPPVAGLATFIGKQFTGVGMNELGDFCVAISGNNFQGQNRSDQIYLSDYTHRPFTDEILVNPKPGGRSSGSVDGAFNKYVQEWAKGDIDSQKAIAKREIAKDGRDMSPNSADKNVNNYASASRIVALCPAGHTRWQPPADLHNIGLRANLELHCARENFGSPNQHTPPEDIPMLGR